MLASLSMTKQSGVRAALCSIATAAAADGGCAGFTLMAFVDAAAVTG